MASDYTNYPLDELATSAEDVLAQGGNFYFKWTCLGCGTRVMCATPNRLYTSMLHEDCGHVTNTQETGGNYLAIMPGTPDPYSPNPTPKSDVDKGPS